MYLYIDGKVIPVGEVIKDFRGDSHVFSGVSSAPSPGKSGKVLVNRWANGTGREFYPSVFEGEIK
jgi:hypothetical protein